MKVNRCPVTLKVQYNNERLAQLSISTINKQNKDTHKRLQTSYRCEYCQKYHVSSMSKAKTTAIQKNMKEQSVKVIEKKGMNEYIDARLDYLTNKKAKRRG